MVDRAISVLMPVRAVDRYFLTALASLARQTIQNFETVIVAPDAAHDAIAAATASVGLTDVVLVSDPKRGLAAALNEALMCCRGTYVARMDADDVCEPERFRRQLAAFVADESLDVVGSAAVLIDANDAVVGRRGPLRDRIVTMSDVLFGNPVVHPSVVFRRSMTAAAGHYDPTALAEDYDLWIRLVGKGAKIAILADPLIRYRIHPDQLSFDVAGSRRCAQIASTIKIYLAPGAPVLSRIAAAVWQIRGAIVAVKAIYRKRFRCFGC